jgi:adenylyl-sulfate kinase
MPIESFTVWFTGLSGAGKSTLARALGKHLETLSIRHEVLDGDELRRTICKDLGFTKDDRDENVRRIAAAAQELNSQNVTAIVAAIAPYQDARLKARHACGPRFAEVFVDCPFETLLERDTKGFYRRAQAGEIEHFTGVSDPYERPQDPEIYLNSHAQPEQQSLALVLRRLEELGYLALLK